MSVQEAGQRALREWGRAQHQSVGYPSGSAWPATDGELPASTRRKRKATDSYIDLPDGNGGTMRLYEAPLTYKFAHGDAPRSTNEGKAAGVVVSSTDESREVIIAHRGLTTLAKRQQPRIWDIARVEWVSPLPGGIRARSTRIGLTKMAYANAVRDACNVVGGMLLLDDP